MPREKLALPHAALALAACAGVVAALAFLARGRVGDSRQPAPHGFVTARGARFVLDGEEFRFVGANAAVTYGADERARMPETLAAAARAGVRVVRVWASGELDEGGATQFAGRRPAPDWLRNGAFRRGPESWNEASFAHLDRTLAEAARLNLRVQLCLANWWPDTGGVAQYLAWAGVEGAFDETQPHGLNAERAVLFYTHEGARRLYRRHVEKILTRRNTVSGRLYREDPTIFSYELMNEAQAPGGRHDERRAWVAEMSAYAKTLDPHHLVTPGVWGYRNAFERRGWLADHALPSVDYCDVHLYPRDDADVYVNTPEALRAFLDNRAAAALSVGKPLVVGEFNVPAEGFNNLSRPKWFYSFFDAAARAGIGGAMFWILTHDEGRQYGVTYASGRDEPLRAELARAARLFDSLRGEEAPARLRDAGRHLVPHQFAFARQAGDAAARPELKARDNGTLLYRFRPEQAARGRFEKLGAGPGYVWGDGVGFFEYAVPAREEWRRVGELVVRAHLQPTPPADARGRVSSTRVTLFVNNRDCGLRLVPAVAKPGAHIEEWRVTSWPVRLDAARGRPLRVRFAVGPAADQPFGLTISNFPEGFDARGALPVEVEVR